MSSEVTRVLKLLFGLIANKVRTYAVAKLQDGGLTAQKFSALFMCELDEIKHKLDALCRKDLSMSISCLKQGVERLQMSLTSEIQKDGKQTQAATNFSASISTQTKPARQLSSVDDALALASYIGRVKIESNKRFELAKESFKKAAEKASEAFHNVSLSMNERFLACKVRIASGILEHLDDPEVAASDCLHYLRELHDLPAVTDVFSVYIKAGITSWLKSGFNSDSRTEIAETVTMINLTLAGFISTFTTRRMATYDWPMIKCGKQFVHPIHLKKDNLPNLKEMEITPPWDMIEGFEADVRGSVFNAKGDLVFVSSDRRGFQKVEKRTGKLHPLQNTRDFGPVCDLAVDDDDTVYVLAGEENVGYTLLVYIADGENAHHWSLEFLREVRKLDFTISVDKDKNIVICGEHSGKDNIRVWLCDSRGELRNSFVAPLTEYHNLEFVFVSRNSEIILVTRKQVVLLKDLYMLHIYTKDGHSQKTVPFRPRQGDLMPTMGRGGYRSLCYNDVTENIIGCVNLSYDGEILVEFLSYQTGELLYSRLLHETNLPKDLCKYRLVCHTDGTLAFVGTNRILFLKSPI